MSQAIRQEDFFQESVGEQVDEKPVVVAYNREAVGALVLKAQQRLLQALDALSVLEGIAPHYPLPAEVVDLLKTIESRVATLLRGESGQQITERAEEDEEFTSHLRRPLEDERFVDEDKILNARITNALAGRSIRYFGDLVSMMLVQHGEENPSFEWRLVPAITGRSGRYWHLGKLVRNYGRTCHKQMGDWMKSRFNLQKLSVAEALALKRYKVERVQEMFDSWKQDNKIDGRFFNMLDARTFFEQRVEELRNMGVSKEEFADIF